MIKECIAVNKEDARTGVSRPQIKKCVRAWPTRRFHASTALLTPPLRLSPSGSLRANIRSSLVQL